MCDAVQILDDPVDGKRMAAEPEITADVQSVRRIGCQVVEQWSVSHDGCVVLLPGKYGDGLRRMLG